MSSNPRWEALDAALSGEVILPGSAEYETASQALNARFDGVRPRAVVRCAGPEDVGEALWFAARHGMPVATRGGGHCFGGRSSTDGVLVEVTPRHSVQVAGGTVTIGGGTRLGEVYGSLLEHGSVIPGGSCPSVGIAGLTLGGGLGIIGRTHGLTSDSLLRVQVVLADGRVLGCDEHNHEDLFWALRGGGAGNFGVVTELTFRTIPAPGATNFHLSWPFSRAVRAIDAWQAWAPSGPDELSASLVIGAGPVVEDPPTVELFGVMLGTRSDADGVLEEVVARVGSDPTSTFREQMSFRETV